jgi:FkbM family methyltransferase
MISNSKPSLQSFIDKNLWRISFFTGHPAFRKHPLLTIGRLVAWQLFKISGYKPSVKVHDSSVISLQPGKKVGVHGFIYIFRNDLEPQVNYAIQNHAQSGDICYDIGANIGFWTLKMAELVGRDGKVYAFEPMSDNLTLLHRNIKSSQLEGNIEVVPFALGDREGTAKIYIPIDPGSTSMAPETANDRCEEVNLRKLDDIWIEQGRPDVKFIKMDVEGSEPFVLEGGIQFFQKVRPIIICEINSRKLSPLGKKADDIFDIFFSWGYDMFTFNEKDNTMSKIEERQDGDILFIPHN